MKELSSSKGTHMELTLESRPVSTNSICFSASPWICISGVKKNHPSCSEVIHTENRLVYLVDEPPIHLPILELLLFMKWLSVLNWTIFHCALYQPYHTKQREASEMSGQGLVCKPCGLLGTEASCAGYAETFKAWLWAVCPTQLAYALPPVLRVLPSRACVPSWIWPEVKGTRLGTAELDAGVGGWGKQAWSMNLEKRLLFTIIVCFCQLASEFLQGWDATAQRKRWLWGWTHTCTCTNHT